VTPCLLPKLDGVREPAHADGREPPPRAPRVGQHADVGEVGARREWGWFLAWFVVAAAFAVGLLGAFTIGIVALPVAIGLIVLLATRRHDSAARAGALSGFGLPLLYVGYLNRGGPGTVCSVSPSGTSCTDEWAPLPWLIAGAAMLVGGVVAFLRVGRAHARAGGG
jgi:hypothetical protein